MGRVSDKEGECADSVLGKAAGIAMGKGLPRDNGNVLLGGRETRF